MTSTISELDRAYLPMVESDHLVQTDQLALNWAEAGLHHIQGGEQLRDLLRIHMLHDSNQEKAIIDSGKGSWTDGKGNLET
jgi:hypothetical protein